MTDNHTIGRVRNIGDALPIKVEVSFSGECLSTTSWSVEGLAGSRTRLGEALDTRGDSPIHVQLEFADGTKCQFQVDEGADLPHVAHEVVGQWTTTQCPCCAAAGAS